MKSGLIKKVLLVGVVLVLVVLFFAFDLQSYLTLSYLKESRESFQALYDKHTFLVLSSYFIGYIVVVALNLPGAAVMTLAGGAMFGFTTGVIVVSFASTIGATLANFLARYLFRDAIQKKFGDKLEKVNQGIEQEGAFYLFTMRLIPAIPFFAINLIMGLTTMPLRTFYWVSQLGMLPGTMVYVNAGKELGKLESLSDILSLQLILSFALLGLFPLLTKKMMTWIRKKQGKEILQDNSDVTAGTDDKEQKNE